METAGGVVDVAVDVEHDHFESEHTWWNEQNDSDNDEDGDKIERIGKGFVLGIVVDRKVDMRNMLGGTAHSTLCEI